MAELQQVAKLLIALTEVGSKIEGQWLGIEDVANQNWGESGMNGSP